MEDQTDITLLVIQHDVEASPHNLYEQQEAIERVAPVILEE